ncbi:MAG: hypothetical protein GY842_17685 [bacterium]|nr:hypothetical protein [bacterium]
MVIFRLVLPLEVWWLSVDERPRCPPLREGFNGTVSRDRPWLGVGRRRRRWGDFVQLRGNTTMNKAKLLVPTILAIGLHAGCASTGSSAERFGKTFYLDGAGNWGFGSSEVPLGLRQGGYRGDVEIFVWTMTLNPLADQLNVVGARLRAAELANRITAYARKYPQNQVNVVALSAGTGVATWAIENLPSSVKVNNFVLLGSSLSYDYDMRRTLSHMEGKIYTYHSEHDTVLQAVRVVGTIDQKRGVDSIGLCGLKPPPGLESRVVNTAWSRTARWRRLGWAGAHTDCTNQTFVRHEIAPRLIGAVKEDSRAASDERPQSRRPRLSRLSRQPLQSRQPITAVSH